MYPAARICCSIWTPSGASSMRRSRTKLRLATAEQASGYRLSRGRGQGSARGDVREAAEQEDLAEGGGDGGLDAEDRRAERDGGEAALDEGVDLARDPAAFGADREGERGWSSGDGVLDRRRAGVGDQLEHRRAGPARVE